MHISGLAPFSSYKTILKQQLNGEKGDAGHLSAFGDIFHMSILPCKWSLPAIRWFSFAIIGLISSHYYVPVVTDELLR